MRGVSAFETALDRLGPDPLLRAQPSGPHPSTVSDASHAQADSLEAQRPFQPRALGVFTLLPRDVVDASAARMAQVPEQLGRGEATLGVVSSDLAHGLRNVDAQARERLTLGRNLQPGSDRDHAQAGGAAPRAQALRAARTHRLVPRPIDLSRPGCEDGRSDGRRHPRRAESGVGASTDVVTIDLRSVTEELRTRRAAPTWHRRPRRWR